MNDIIQKSCNLKSILIIGMYFIVALIQACSGNFDLSEKMDEKVVAMVNDVPIFIGDINDRFGKLEKELDSQLLKDEKTVADLKRAILKELITRKLLVSEAQSRGFKIYIKDLEREKQKMYAGLTNDEIKDALADARLTQERLEESIREELLILRLIDSISTDLSVSEEEAGDYYEINKEQFYQQESVRARQIVVSTDEEARNIRKALIDGEDFAKLAGEFSLSPDSGKGGDLGFFHKGQLPRELEEAAFSLKPGQLSQVIETPYGYHILKTEEGKPAKQLDQDEVKDQINIILLTRKKEEKHNQLLTDLWQKARIEYNRKYKDFLPENE